MTTPMQAPTIASEPDSTVQAFASYLTEMRWRNGNTVNQLLSEMSIIRDGITNNCGDLTEFKRHSSQIAQQMQCQLSDLREKLTNAFGEITALVKQKTMSDQDMMKDINSLNQSLSYKTAEVEALKRSYAATHQQLQNQLIQIQNHLSVTGTELHNAKSHVDQVQKDSVHNFTEMEQSLKRSEDQLIVGSQENRGQMFQVSEEIQRIHEHLTQVSGDFMKFKDSVNAQNQKLQQQLWALEEQQKRRIARPVMTPTSVQVSPGKAMNLPSPPGRPTMPSQAAGNTAIPWDAQSVTSSVNARQTVMGYQPPKPWGRLTSGQLSTGLATSPLSTQPLTTGGLSNPGRASGVFGLK